MNEDLYSILGVSRDASEEDIRKAYRKLARKHHPDVNPGDTAAEDRFKKLSAAYEVLSKPEKRKLYDEFGADAQKIGYDPERAEEYRQWKRQAEAAASYGGSPFGGFGGFGGHGEQGVVDLEDLFGDLFSRGQQRGRPRPRAGHDVEATLRIPFRDAARGGPTTVEVPRRGPDGSVEASRLSVTIPKGVESGQRLRLAGQGEPGREGGPPGDLYVRIDVEPDPVFRRNGRDLELTLPISVAESLQGGSADVPTLSGAVRLKIPPRAQSGQRLRLRGKGIEPAKGDAGDLYVVLEIVAPQGGDDASRARIAEEIALLYDGDVRAELHRRAQ